MTYGPPDAQYPPSPMTTALPMESSEKQNANSSHEAKDPSARQSGVWRRPPLIESLMRSPPP
jgi:hypothetical protein